MRSAIDRVILVVMVSMVYNDIIHGAYTFPSKRMIKDIIFNSS